MIITCILEFLVHYSCNERLLLTEGNDFTNPDTVGIESCIYFYCTIVIVFLEITAQTALFNVHQMLPIYTVLHCYSIKSILITVM